MEKKLPSVTQILKIIHSFDLEALQRAKGWRAFDEMMGAAAKRGKAFHSLTESIDRGEDLDDLLMGLKHGEYAYLEKAIRDYNKWFQENVEETFIIEDRLVCDTYGFTGRPDLVAKIKGKKRIVCIEKKFTFKILNTHKYQGAAYCYLAEKKLGKPVSNRLILRFQESGLVEQKFILDKVKDFNLFICALNLWRENS